MTEEWAKFFTTNDNVRMHYLTAGDGPPIVLIPGFRQSAAEFLKQIDDFRSDHRVIAMDLRGHGLSENTDHGYRVARLAADLRDLLEQLDLHDVSVVAHSLGVTVAWAYWDLFAGDRIGRLVLVDQAPIAASDAAPPGRAEELGAIFSRDMARGIREGLRGPDPVAAWQPVLNMMHTLEMSAKDLDWIADENALLLPEHTVTLFNDHYGNDWRDVPRRITVPTLVLGGAGSFFSPTVAQWLAAEIPSAELRIFTSEEKGSHLMFWENAPLFNSVVREFLEKNPVA
ncbi:alpha/beta fold hydrolase [Actinoplanes sp. NPDC051343]|uniref:alpha/beta fold hydrolase n=1 Tax=Actinoplanes sp. NPDC051343 TaxID=3363906 RepID=UPI0037A49C37